MAMSVDTILHNARIATNEVPSFVEAVAISAGKISAAGNDDEILRLRETGTQVIDANRRTVIPGLNDSHMHPIRGGLNYNMELRWDGVPSLADALRMLKEQAARTPAPHWVLVVGGWLESRIILRRTMDQGLPTEGRSVLNAGVNNEVTAAPHSPENNGTVERAQRASECPA